MNHLEQTAAWRIIDANLNRASEALRVVEEYARFQRENGSETAACKQLRHELGVIATLLPLDKLLGARDTEHDPGTNISLPSESQRASSEHLLRANFQRFQQAVRAMEEYAKFVARDVAGRLEQLRYQSYTLEKTLFRAMNRRPELASARLYVLIDGRATLAAFEELVSLLVTAGVDILQLRDKELDDRPLLDRAHALRRITTGTRTLFVMNDRPDLALLADADGVHVGQEELRVQDVRRIVGPSKIIGVSTHVRAQAEQAERDGADYIGCGPTFPSSTKQFTQFAGLEFLKQVAATNSLPAFAIGGIQLSNVADVLATGITRIAVRDAIVSVADPVKAIREFRLALDGKG